VVFTTLDALPEWKAIPRTGSSSAYANIPHVSVPAIGDSVSALRRHLASQLPDYMIPSAFVTLEDFPLTPNGKVDRKALPSPSEAAVPSAPRQIVAARNENESKLLEIWKQVLGTDDVGVEDDIFELGGDSILIFQITTRATRSGLSVTPAQVFRLRNIAAIAAATTSSGAITSEPSIQPVNRDAYRRKI
jgi:hypothetical protein